MALVKRGKTWHTHFFVDGVRYRQSLETGDWREAQSKEKVLIAQAAQGILNASHKGFGKLAFAQAAESYFSGRKLELGESSQKKERQLLVKPCEFFQQKCLSKISIEDVLRFREWRSESGVGPALINMEVGVIRRMLKRARRWHLFGADIRPLKEPRSIGKALTYDEKLSLLHTAGQNEEWQRAEAAMSLALCTTMRGCEIKQLQWQDIDFLNRIILVRASKTEAGQRLIPMNKEANEVILRLRERARYLAQARDVVLVLLDDVEGHGERQICEVQVWPVHLAHGHRIFLEIVVRDALFERALKKRVRERVLLWKAADGNGLQPLQEPRVAVVSTLDCRERVVEVELEERCTAADPTFEAHEMLAVE